MLVNGVFAGAEIAVLSVRRTRLSELAESGSRAVRAIVALRANPEKFLATVQIGITVVGTTAAAYGGAHLTTTFADFIRFVPFLSPYADSIGVTLVVAMISFLELVFGELVPKSIALRSAEAYSRLVARPLLFLSVLASPVVALLTASSNLVLRAFGDKTNFIEARVSPEELRQLVDEAARNRIVKPPHLHGEQPCGTLAPPGRRAALVLCFQLCCFAHCAFLPRSRPPVPYTAPEYSP